MTATTARATVSGSHRSLRLGTRGSPLALAQAGQIARRLQERSGRPAVLVTVATPGDGSTAPIERLGTTGVFTSTLREALLRGGVDALVLAMAGLSRLGMLHAVASPLDPSVLMPAPAQGVLAVECRSDDPATAAEVSALDHAPTRAAATTERGFLAGLGTGCSVPAGALAVPAPGPGGEPAVRVSGVIAAADGSTVIRGRVTGPAGDPLGRQLARILLQHGGAAPLDQAPAAPADSELSYRRFFRLVRAG